VRGGKKVVGRRWPRPVAYLVPMAFFFRRGRKGSIVSIARSRAGLRPREAGPAAEGGGRARAGRAEARREGGDALRLGRAVAEQFD